MNSKEKSQPNCHHCGEICEEILSFENKNFCCIGCKTVFELLQSTHLSTYYSEIKKQNKSYSFFKAKRKYAFLMNNEYEEHFIHFKNETLSMTHFYLPGIHCSSCIYLLEQLPKLNQDILKSEVNFLKKSIQITFKNQNMTLADLVILLAQLGYPPHLSLQDAQAKKLHIPNQNLGMKIAVSGFCFGNAMLMNMPEYFNHDLMLSAHFKEFFGYINLVLSLPIVLFAGKDYFVRAAKGLQMGQVNIDVPIALGIATLFLRSFVEIIFYHQSGYVDSLTGLVFFLLIGKWYQAKSYQALSFERDYTSYFPISVLCHDKSKRVYKKIDSIQKGDVVIIHHDELIPADGIILNGTGHIDYSFVTGEADLIEKNKDQKVYAGGRQKGGEIAIKLLKTIKNSELTNLWNQDVFKKNTRNYIQNLLDSLSKYFTLIIIVVAFVTGLYWWVVAPPIMWNAVTAVLIVFCPCALALVIPFAYGHALRLLGREGFYLKNTSILENIAKIKKIVFDKTGTLTQDSKKITFEGESLSKMDKKMLHSVFKHSAHPLSVMIAKVLPSTSDFSIRNFKEYMGKGFEVSLNQHHFKVGSAAFVPISTSNGACKGASQVHVMRDRKYLGYFAIRSHYKNGIFSLLKKLKKDFSLYLLSGDNDAEEKTLSPYFHSLYFQQKPLDKLQFVQKLGSNQMVIGDGLNDAGALKQASVGVSVAGDIYQFSPACDIIVNPEGFLKLIHLFAFVKWLKIIVLLAFSLSFCYNIIGLSFAVSGHLSPLVSAILMPLSSVTVVFFVTIMVTLAHKYCFKKKK